MNLNIVHWRVPLTWWRDGHWSPVNYLTIYWLHRWRFQFWQRISDPWYVWSYCYRWKKGYGRCWNGSWILAKLLVLYLFFWCLHPWQPNKIHRRPSEALTQRLVFLSDRLAAWLKKPKARSTRLTDSTCTFKLLWSLWSPWSNNLLPMETVSEKIHHFEVGNVIRFYLFSVHWFQNPNNWQ